MSEEALFKYVNVLDAKGRPMRDRKSGRLVSQRVKLTDEEVTALKIERGEIEQDQI